LDRADVNGDGLPDFVTNYELSGYIRITFHPGFEDVKKRWPAVTIGRGSNSESSALADLDGDGNVDAAFVHGGEATSSKDKPGLRIIWGPSSEKVMDPAAWIDGGDVPLSIGEYQYNYVKSRDMNGDGFPDVIAGGRGTKVKTGIRWFEAPANPAERRDLSKWALHLLDPECEGGHGFRFGDIDGDGDDDMANANTDFDTPEDAEAIYWYENPGPSSPEVKLPWPKHLVYKGPEFFTKEVVDVGDLDGDGKNDLVIQTENEIYWFKNQGASPVSFERVVIPKDPRTQWRGRNIKIIDLNGDGRMDIAGMLIHVDGQLPKDKAAIFWMEYTGNRPEAGGWLTHVIKWADGFEGYGTWQGEKWDQFDFIDLDGDGDLDIIANCEEYHTGLFEAILAVQWFENPMR
jgi:hypothetical protein